MTAPLKFKSEGWGGLAASLRVDSRIRQRRFLCSVFEEGVRARAEFRSFPGTPEVVAILEQLSELIERHPDSARAPVEVFARVRQLLIQLSPLVRKGSVSGLLSKWSWQLIARRYRIFKSVSKFSLWQRHSELLTSLVALLQGRSIPEMPPEVQPMLFELLRRCEFFFAEALRQGEANPIRKLKKGHKPLPISWELYETLVALNVEGSP